MSAQTVRDMPYDDFKKWYAFFERVPIGWKDDLRAFKIMQSMGVKEKPESQFASLASLKRSEEKQKENSENRISAANLIRSSLFTKMISATGGEKLEWMK